MPRKAETPNINSATFRYNGDKKSFDIFMEGLIRSYLEQGSVPKSAAEASVEKVELSENSA
ncbi:hypothetical protein SAMN02910447_03125 [Ruminococcus sp. YE71]|uniref:hypothetical protein n=1 Tax=unclassified Ruminococcus TaxID=2608920 RepID=UPI00087E54B1|nr:MULTISPECIES: hypothetical protein [unclassified Ruminococcus]SDA29970.1 hypothetical protein SAMN02910446_03196 [Ruminococcus sp. YE78]SFW49062.1 hypothetical protein SAMN02910447_03125 [Ruminococcus sp. YE71]